MKRYGFALIGASLLFVSGCSSTSQPIEVIGKNDQLEPKIKVSTYGFDSPFMGIVNPWDSYFRGYIDKTSLAKTYQLYIVTNSVDWMYWDQARFLVNGELVSLTATRVGYDVECSEYGCAHFEDMVVNVDENTLIKWAQESNDISVRLASSKVTSTVDIEVDPSEVKLFLSEMTSN
tara:strand:+ start:1988 stop:2515 length:528 start_codon:yes stop_codon:yes gene_type:complete